MKRAREIKVGDAVDFEGDGSMVRVDAIEPNYDADGFECSPFLRKEYGMSLYFSGTYVDENGEEICPTAFVRREGSPISGWVIR